MITLTIISSVYIYICIYLLLNQCDQSYSSLHRVIYVLTEVYFDLYIMKHTDIPDYINIQTILF